MKNMGITQQWWWNHENGRSCDIRAWRRIYPRIHDDMAIIECSIWSTINVLQSPPQKYPRVQLSIHEHWDWTSTKSYWDRSDFTDTHAHTHTPGYKNTRFVGGIQLVDAMEFSGINMLIQNLRVSQPGDRRWGSLDFPNTGDTGWSTSSPLYPTLIDALTTSAG